MRIALRSIQPYLWPMPKPMPDSSAPRPVRLFRNGRNQALRIPVEFELPGNQALIHREGDRLVIEPVRPRGLVELLTTLEPIEDAFPDVDAALPALDDVEV